MVDINTRRDGKPVVNIDVPAVVSQFLSELTTFDLVVELVQNDLDAGATRTELSFLSDRVQCQGNGAYIDAKGWKRLAVILGAGTSVQPKQDGIGSKNHGLKSAFLFGDDIIVQSAGHRADLTVRGNLERPDLFYPAAWPRIADPDAPANGTRVTIPLRTAPIAVPERNPLAPLSSDELVGIFDDAVNRAADRFIGASAPGRRWVYTLVLATAYRKLAFKFECAPSSVPGFWQRTCTLSEDGKRSVTLARRQCFPFKLKLDANDQAKVPRLYRRGNGLLGELSWLVGDKGKPVPQDGGYRYPIAYPHEHVSSGLGFDISGPFISGRARHTVSDDARNGLIRTAGEEAFVELMKRRLLPTFGPEALVLASSATRQDHGVEERIAESLLAEHAFSVLSLSRAKTDVEMPIAGGAILLALPTYAVDRITPRVARLASSVGQVLHPKTPHSFVATAVRLAKAKRAELRIYSEIDAAEDVLVNGRPEGLEGFEPWLARCTDIIAELELARGHGALPNDYLKTLRARAFLPTSERSAGEWNKVRRAKKAPPQVPGVKAPLLLHTSLARASLFRDGSGKVALFEIDDYLSRLDFAPTTPSVRGRFFGWLRTGHSGLKPKTLAAIGTYPIWPSAVGSYHPLDYYCVPRSQYLRDILAEVRDRPDASLVSFPGLKRSSNGSLRLRKTPTSEELNEWHEKTMAAASAAEEEGKGGAPAIVEATEAALASLRRDGYAIAAIATDHRSMSQAGTLRSVSELHVASPAVVACQLLADDLAHTAPPGLLEHLGAHVSPTAAAIVRALRDQPRTDALFSRLASYRDRGMDLGSLADEAIVAVGGTLRAPGTLCFKSTIDWWGDWKTPLDDMPSVPEHVELLEQVGVVRASLREDWSRGFFDWLQVQPVSVQFAHLRQVVRHWGERKAGPSKWVDRNSDRKCVPVRDRDGKLELQSMKTATMTRGWTFLPDLNELNKAVLDDNPRLRLAIVDVPGVDGSIIDLLRRAGIPSLRDLAGDPVRTETSSEIAAAPDLDQELVLVKSRAGDLTKRLARMDVDTTLLRHKWRWLLTELKGVRTAQRLTSIYRVFKREYERATPSGVDLATQQVCVTQGAEQLQRFYSALARHLFLPGTSELYAYGLKLAVHSEKQADLFEGLDPGGAEPEPVEPDEDAPNKGHGGSGAAASNTAPSPRPLTPITNPTYVKTPKRDRRRPKPGDGTGSKRNSLEEAEHILQLKENHYAWHCQACLGALEVEVATPPGTYVFQAQERKALIEAHHVKHLQNEGGLGGENLLILCQLHHRLLGDTVSRETVLAALAAPTPATRRFPVGAGVSQVSEYKGQVVVLDLQMAPFQLPLFFTPEHAKAWLGGRSGAKPSKRFQIVP